MNNKEMYLLGKNFIDEFDQDYEDFEEDIEDPNKFKKFLQKLPENPAELYLPVSKPNYSVAIDGSSLYRIGNRKEIPTFWDKAYQIPKRLGHDFMSIGINTANAVDYWSTVIPKASPLNALTEQQHEIETKLNNAMKPYKDKYFELKKDGTVKNYQEFLDLVYQVPEISLLKNSLDFLNSNRDTLIQENQKDIAKKLDMFQTRNKVLSETFELNPEADTIFSDVAGGMGTSFGVALFGGGNPYAMLGVGALAEAQSLANETWKLTEGKGLTDEERISKANTAFGIGTLIGWTEATPVSRGIERIFGSAKDKSLKSLAKNVLYEMGEEGIQETFQTAGEEFTKQALVPDYKANYGDIAYAGLVGALSGGGMALGMSGVSKGMDNIEYFNFNNYVTDQKKFAKQLYKAEMISKDDYKEMVSKDNAQWKEGYKKYKESNEALLSTKKTLDNIVKDEPIDDNTINIIRETEAFKTELESTKNERQAFDNVIGKIKALESSMDDNELSQIETEINTFDRQKKSIENEGIKALAGDIYEDEKVFNQIVYKLETNPEKHFENLKADDSIIYQGENNSTLTVTPDNKVVIQKPNADGLTKDIVTKEAVSDNILDVFADVKDVFQPKLKEKVTFNVKNSEDHQWIPTKNLKVVEDFKTVKEQNEQRILQETEKKINDLTLKQHEPYLKPFKDKISKKTATVSKFDNVLKAKSRFQNNPSEDNLQTLGESLLAANIPVEEVIPTDSENVIEDTLKNLSRDKVRVSDTWIPVRNGNSEDIINTYLEVKNALFKSKLIKSDMSSDISFDEDKETNFAQMIISNLRKNTDEVFAKPLIDKLKISDSYEFYKEFTKLFIKMSALDMSLFDIRRLTVQEFLSDFDNPTNEFVNLIKQMYQLVDTIEKSELKVKTGDFVVTSVAQAMLLKHFFPNQINIVEDWNLDKQDMINLYPKSLFDEEIDENNIQRTPNNIFEVLLKPIGKVEIEKEVTSIKVEIQEVFSVANVRANRNKNFLFGDNLEGKGKGGQAVIRDEPNAFGIPTKKKPSMNEDAFFTDEEYDVNVIAIDNAFDKIPKEGIIVLPSAGLGTGLAELNKRAPKTFEYLQNKLKTLYGYTLNSSQEGQGDTNEDEGIDNITEEEVAFPEAEYVGIPVDREFVSDEYVNPKNWKNTWFVLGKVGLFGENELKSKPYAQKLWKFTKEIFKSTAERIKNLSNLDMILVDSMDDVDDNIKEVALLKNVPIILKGDIKKLSERLGDKFKKVAFFITNQGYPMRTKVNAYMADMTLAIYENNLTPGEKLTKQYATDKTVKKTEKNEYGFDVSELIPVGKDQQRYYGFNLNVIEENKDLYIQQFADQIIRQLANTTPNDKGVINFSLNIAGNSIANTIRSQEELDILVDEILTKAWAIVEQNNKLANRKVKLSIRTGMQTGIDESGFKWALKNDVFINSAIPSNYRLVQEDGTETNDIITFFERFVDKTEIKQEPVKSNQADITIDNFNVLEKDPLISDWTDFVVEQLKDEVQIYKVDNNYSIQTNKGLVSLNGKKAAYYQGKIYLNMSKDVIPTNLDMYREVSHELTHQFLNKLLDTNTAFYSEMFAIANDTFRALKNSPAYYKYQSDFDRILKYQATNPQKFVKEFIAYAMSNTSQLHQYMKVTEYENTLSWWGKFVLTIKNFLKGFAKQNGYDPSIMDAVENVLSRRVNYNKNILSQEVQNISNDMASLIFNVTSALIETDSFVSSGSVRTIGFEIAKARQETMGNDDFIAYVQQMDKATLKQSLQMIEGYNVALKSLYEKTKKENESFEEFMEATLTHTFNTIQNLKRHNVIRPVENERENAEKLVTIEELPLNYKDHEGVSKSSYFNNTRLNKSLETLTKLFNTPLKLAFVEQKKVIDKSGREIYTKIVAPGMMNANLVHMFDNSKYMWIGNFGALNSAVVVEFESVKAKEDAQVILDEVLNRTYPQVIGEDYQKSLSTGLRVLIEDLRLGAQIIDDKQIQSTFSEDTNPIKMLKRHYDLSPMFQAQVTPEQSNALVEEVKVLNQEQKPLGVSVKGGKVVFNTFFFNSEMSDGNIEVMIDGKPVTFNLQDVLTNTFGKETTDGAIFYLEGIFDTIYRKAFGVRKNGVIKAWGSNNDDMLPLYLKGAYHRVGNVNNNLLAQWMIQNNVSMIVSNSSVKVNGVRGEGYYVGDIKELQEGVSKTNELPLDIFNRQSEKETFEHEGMGLSSGMSRNLFTQYNPIFSDNQLNISLTKVLSNTKRDLDKALLGMNSASLMNTVLNILDKPLGSKMDVLMAKMIATVIRGENIANPALAKEWSDTFKAGQDRLKEDAFNKIGAIFNEPFFAKMFQSYIKENIYDYLGWNLPSYWGVIRPDTGYLEANHVEVVYRTLRNSYNTKARKLRDAVDKKYKIEDLREEKKSINAELETSEDEARIEILKKSKEMVAKLISDYGNEIDKIDKNKEELFAKEYEKIIDPLSGRLREGYGYVSSDMAKAINPKTRDKRINEVTVDKAVDDLLDYPTTELINFLVSDKIGKNIDDALIEEGDLDNVLKAIGESPLSYVDQDGNVIRSLELGNESEIVSMLRLSTGLDITAIGFTIVEGEVSIALTLESGSTALLGANKAMSVGEKDFESDEVDDMITLIAYQATAFENSTYKIKRTKLEISELNKQTFGQEVIGTAIPTDSIFSQQPITIAGVLDDLESSSITVDSDHWQTRAGKDYDIDTILLTYYDPEYWLDKGTVGTLQDDGKVIFQDFPVNHFKKVVDSLREGKKNLIKEMLRVYRSLGIPVSSEEDLYLESNQIQFVQKFLPPVKNSGKFGSINPYTFELLDMYPKKVGGLIKEKAMYTMMGQTGLQTELDIDIPEMLLNFAYENGIELPKRTIPINATDKKRTLEVSLVFQRLLNDMVDKPTNTNSFSYFYNPENIDTFKLKYGNEIQGLIDFTNKIIFEASIDKDIFRVVNDIAEEFLSYLTIVVPKTVQASNEVLFGIPFNARKDVHTRDTNALYSYQDLIKGILEQQTINGLIKESDSEGLAKFAIESAKDKSGVSTFWDVDRNLLEQYFLNIESFDSMDNSPMVNMYDGIDLNKVPTTTTSVNDYVSWINTVKTEFNNFIANAPFKPNPTRTYGQILEALNPVKKEKIKSEEQEANLIGYYITKFLGTTSDMKDWSLEKFYQKRKYHNLKVDLIAILGATSWTKYSNQYWQALGIEYDKLIAWSRGETWIPKKKFDNRNQEYKDVNIELMYTNELQQSMLRDFPDYLKLLMDSKRTFSKDLLSAKIDKKYLTEDGKKIKPFMLSNYKTWRGGREELWLVPHDQGIRFELRVDNEAKFSFDTLQQLGLEANSEKGHFALAQHIISELHRTSAIAAENHDIRIRQNNTVPNAINTSNKANIDMYLFFSSVDLRGSTLFEQRMELAVTKINNFLVDNPNDKIYVDEILKSLFNVPTSYTPSSTYKITSNIQYNDMLSPYDKFADNTTVWELILNTKPELAKQLTEIFAKSYTGRSFEERQKIDSSMTMLMADDDVFFDEDIEIVKPGDDIKINDDVVSSILMDSVFNVIGKAVAKSAKTNSWDHNFNELDQSVKEIMQMKIDEIPNLLAKKFNEEVTIPITVNNVVNTFSGSELTSKVEGINNEQIAVTKQISYMELNREITAMENRIDLQIKSYTDILKTNWRTENNTLSEKFKSILGKSKDNLNADVITKVAVMVHTNPNNVIVRTNAQGKLEFVRSTVSSDFIVSENVYTTIEDYVNSLGNLSSSEKALESAALGYRIKYHNYANIANQMVKWLDLKIVNYEMTAEQERTSGTLTDQGYEAIISELKKLKYRYEKQAEKFSGNRFYPLTLDLQTFKDQIALFFKDKLDQTINYHFDLSGFVYFGDWLEALNSDTMDEWQLDEYHNKRLLKARLAFNAVKAQEAKVTEDALRIVYEKGWGKEVYLDLLYNMDSFKYWLWTKQIPQMSGMRSLNGVAKYRNVVFGGLHNDLTNINWLELNMKENSKLEGARAKNVEMLSILKRWFNMISNSRGLQKELVPVSKIKKGDRIAFAYEYSYYDKETEKTVVVKRVKEGIVKEEKGKTIRLVETPVDFQGMNEQILASMGYSRILFEEGENFTIEDIIARQHIKHENIKNDESPISREQKQFIKDLLALGFLNQDEIAGYEQWTKGYASGVILPAYESLIHSRWDNKGYSKEQVVEIDYEERVTYTEEMTAEHIIEKKRSTSLNQKFDDKKEPMVLRINKSKTEKRSVWRDKFKILQMLSSISFLGGPKSGIQNWYDGSSQLVSDLGIKNWYKGRKAYKKIKKNLINKVETGNFDVIDVAYDMFGQRGSDNELVNSLENTEKMLLVEALTMQYMLKHDLASEGLQASMVEDIEGGVAGAVSKTAKGFLFFFRKAEVMVRRKAAFYLAYKTVMIDGITNPAVAEIAVEKGVGRTQSLYDTVYRRIGEDSDFGKLLFTFSQYGHYQWELRKQDYRLSKQLGEKLQLKELWSSLLHGEKATDTNRKNKFVRKLIYDLALNGMGIMFPGLRSGSAVNRMVIMLLRLLIAAGIDRDDEETKRNLNDVIYSWLAILFGVGVTIPLNAVKYFTEDQSTYKKEGNKFVENKQTVIELIKSGELDLGRTPLTPVWYGLIKAVVDVSNPKQDYGSFERKAGYLISKLSPINPLAYSTRFMNPKERVMGKMNIGQRAVESVTNPSILLEAPLPTNKFYGYEPPKKESTKKDDNGEYKPKKPKKKRKSLRTKRKTLK